MNEEIKKILDYFKREDKNQLGFNEDKLLSYEETTNLLDYITNLRQENQGYEQERKSLYNTIHNLQKDFKTLKILQMKTNEENETLKECYCNRTDCSERIKNSKTYNSVYQEKEDYKSRFDKAINKISLYRMDDITIETHKALDDVLNDLLGK